MFPLGLRLNHIEFQLPTGMVSCNAEVRHTMQARGEPRPIAKIGVQFHDLPTTH